MKWTYYLFVFVYIIYSSKENNQRLTNPNNLTGYRASHKKKEKTSHFPLWSGGLKEGIFLTPSATSTFRKFPWSCLQDFFGECWNQQRDESNLCVFRRAAICDENPWFLDVLVLWGKLTKDLSLWSLALKLMLTTHLVDGCADIWQLRVFHRRTSIRILLWIAMRENSSITLGFAFSFRKAELMNWVNLHMALRSTWTFVDCSHGPSNMFRFPNFSISICFTGTGGAGGISLLSRLPSGKVTFWNLMQNESGRSDGQWLDFSHGRPYGDVFRVDFRFPWLT